MANSVKGVKEVFDNLVKDEVFCRLLMYGNDALNLDKEDITSLIDYEKTVKERIKFSQQIEDLEEMEVVRMFIFRSTSRLREGNSVIRENNIQIDLFVPHRLVDEEERIYTLQDSVEGILDNSTLGISKLNYVDGHFVMSPIKGFSAFRMIFAMKEGRGTNGRY